MKNNAGIVIERNHVVGSMITKKDCLKIYHFSYHAEKFDWIIKIIKGPFTRRYITLQLKGLGFN